MKLWWWVMAAWMAAGFLSAETPAVNAADRIKWYGYEEGIARGKAENKKLFLNFHAEWCTYCTKMDRETFANPTVVAYLNENFIPIKVDADREKKVAVQYKVQGLPSTWFLTPAGEQIGSQPGFIAAKNLLSLMKYIHTDSYKTIAYKDFVKKNP